MYIIASVVVLLLVVVGLVFFLKRGKKAPTPIAEVTAVPRVEAPKAKAEEGLSKKLFRTRGVLAEKLDKIFGGGAKDQKEWDSFEEVLLEADIGFSTTQKLIGNVKKNAGSNGADLKQLFKQECEGLLAPSQKDNFKIPAGIKPYVISIVGVNGVGKTTTIGKLAQRFRDEGQKVLLGAGDTFRAAAISQLKIWADRVGADFVTGREGADPGAVAFDAVTAGKARNADVVILDTAGRLHTKLDLMDELKKVDRVIKKVIPEAPHEIWLVVDGTIGQNSLQQAKEFQKALNLTGIIVTKLDGTAKGGAVLAVSSELGIPIRFIGVGESATDFIPFDPKSFIEAILG